MSGISSEDLTHLRKILSENKEITEAFISLREMMSPAEWDLYEEQLQKEQLEEDLSLGPQPPELKDES